MRENNKKYIEEIKNAKVEEPEKKISFGKYKRIKYYL